MPLTYEPIATTTLSSNQNNVEFTSIPGTYTDLVMVAYARSTTADTSTGSNLVFNSITTATYSGTVMYGTGSVAGSVRASNASNLAQAEIPAANATANVFGVVVYHMQNYSNTTTNKTVLFRSDSLNQARAVVGLWRNTAAITSIKFTPTAGQVASGSIFTLYGIKAA